MDRCVICDHTSGYANEYLHKPSNPGNRVRRRKSGEYLCDQCVKSINTTYREDKDEQEWLEMHLDNKHVFQNQSWSNDT